MPMTSPFEWYDKHFNEIEIVNPVSRTSIHGGVVCTSDPRMLARLKRRPVRVLAVELDPNSIGLQTVRSITVRMLRKRICPPEPCS